MTESVPMANLAPLQDAQRRALRRVAALMIPASEQHDVPGADDEAIFADIQRSLGMEPRPPFRKGFEVEQGEWSLLEPVRARGRIYREVP